MRIKYSLVIMDKLLWTMECVVCTTDKAFVFLFRYLFKSRFVNEMFTASTNTGNFKFVVILENSVYVFRLLCLQVILRTLRMARNMFTIVCIYHFCVQLDSHWGTLGDVP